MLWRLLVALAQLETGNTPGNLLNNICQIIYSLYWAKEITKKRYNNIDELNKSITQYGYYIYEF